MQQIGLWMKRNAWMVLLDIIAVNAAYYLALIIRYYVSSSYNVSALVHLQDFYHFAPFYTVISIAVFIIFRLYNGIWKYAGANDMHRILWANAVTFLIQILGTMFFVNRMPVSYYLIGAVLQLGFTTFIRFAYRIFRTERKRTKNRQQSMINALVVGAGESGMKMVRHLEDQSEYRPVCIVDTVHAYANKTMDGIPVIDDTGSLAEMVKKLDIRAIFISDAMIPDELRNVIQNYCKDHGLEIHDYTGNTIEAGIEAEKEKGSLSMELHQITSPVVLLFPTGERIRYDSGKDITIAIYDQRYQIDTVRVVNSAVEIVMRKIKDDVVISGNWIGEEQVF